MIDNHSTTLPYSWKTIQIGAVATLLRGVTYKKADASEKKREGLAPILRATNITTELTFSNLVYVPESYIKPEQYLRVGDSVIAASSGSRAVVGKAATLKAKWYGAFGAFCFALRPNMRFISPTFLAYFLRTTDYRKAVSSLSAGVNINNLKRQHIEDMHLPFPPRGEQDRIVEAVESYLTRLDAAVETLKRVQANLKRYRASVLKAAVEGRLVPTEAELARREDRDYEPASKLLERILAERRRRWEEDELAKMRAKGRKAQGDKWKAKYKEPVVPDTSDLPTLPEGWCWATLPQLGELNRGKSKHRPRNDPRLLNGPYPFVQTGDVRRSECFIGSYDGTYSAFGLAQSRLWPSGTLCITIAANIAETGILQFDACFPDSVVGFLNLEEPMLIRFIELFMRTAREELDRYAPATAQKNINLGILSELAVPLPPWAEQIRIVEAIDRLFSVVQVNERAVELSRARCQRLRQAILKWAFEGKLVDQDPDDEPASVLLERIKTEREGDKPKRGRGKGNQLELAI